MHVDEQIGLLAARHPDAIAIEDGDQRLTYGQLWMRAESAATEIRASVAPGSLVPIIGHRGIDWVVAMLAVLRSGLAFVPIDLANPAPRWAAMVAEASSGLVICAGPRITSIPGAISLTEMAARQVSGRIGRFHAAPSPSECAYAIFTSGSTGQPKAVLLSHAGLSCLTAWHIRTYTVGPRTRVLHTAGLGFDAAVWELLPNLAAGATIVVASDDTRMVPSRLAEQARQSRIDLFFAPTVIAERLLENVPDNEVTWRTMLTGGDLLHVKRLPVGWQVVNHYGPTEGTVVATTWTVDRIPAHHRAPIGTAISGMLTRVVDEHLQTLPPGEIGELLLGGPMVAMGYHRRPDLTREKFIALPNSPVRWYRTGDLVRQSGTELEFKGRIDSQVQLRGLRVEPGEVEAVLATHPSVRDAVCCSYATPAGQNALGAVAIAGPEITGIALRKYLTSRLPSAMVPSRIICVEQMPLTVNGKVDLPGIRRVLGSLVKESLND